MDLTSIVRDIDHWLREAVAKLNNASDVLNKVKLDLQKLVLLLLPLPAALTEQLLRLADILAGVGTLAPGGDDLLTLSNRMDVISAKLDLALHEIDSTHYNVILPPTAPSGYGGSSSGDVWSYSIPRHTMLTSADPYYSDPANHLTALNNHAIYQGGQEGYLDSRNPDFRLVLADPYDIGFYVRGTYGLTSPNCPSAIDWTDWDGSESLVTFLNRVETEYTWSRVGPDGTTCPNQAWAAIPYRDGAMFRCVYSDWQLPFVSGRWASMLSAGASAPIWPGLANVTLGTPVAIAGTMRVEAVMDGCLVDITTPPTGTGKRLLGTSYYDYGVGEAAFENDDGYLEMWQYLGFRTMLLVPKTMVQASAIQFRLLGGAEGTLTPWTIAA